MKFSGGVGVQVEAQISNAGVELTHVDIISAGAAIQASGSQMAQLVLHECKLDSNTAQTLSLDGNHVFAKMRLTEINGDERTFDLKNGANVICLQVYNMDTLQLINCP